MELKDPSAALDNASAEENVTQKPIPCGRFLGFLYTFLTSLFLTLSSVIVKKMTYISPGQLSLVRNAGVLIWSLPIAVLSGKSLLGPKQDRVLLFFRGFLGATALYLNLLAYRLLPLAEAAIVLSTTPAMVMVGARFYLKERCGVVQSLSLALTIAGVLLSVRLPELLQNSGQNVRFTADYVAGMASALACVLCLAVAFVSIRKMKDVHFSVLLFSMGSVGVVENGLLTWAFSNYGFPLCGTWDPLLMMSVGLFGFVGHYFMTLAIQAEAVGVVSVVRSASDIVVALLFQVAFFGDRPDTYNACGAVVVVAAVSAIGVSKWLQQLPAEAEARRRLRWLLL